MENYLEYKQSDTVKEALLSEVSVGLDYFLGDVRPTVCPQSVAADKKIEILSLDNMSMRYLSYGSESISFVVETSNEKLVVKTGQNIIHSPRGFNQYPLRKEYICEQVARNILSTKYSNILEAYSIRVNPILFANARFSIEAFAYGDRATNDDIPRNDFNKSIFAILRVLERTEPSWVWKNLEPDTNQEGFIKTDYGLTWIDPFTRFQKLRTWLYE